ncbi:MAG: hypothetical protein MZV63_46165 [Marinilabiliales bacterium]|nr:hypothetical protein [Marinilabiliales bacterium]
MKRTSPVWSVTFFPSRQTENRIFSKEIPDRARERERANQERGERWPDLRDRLAETFGKTVAITGRPALGIRCPSCRDDNISRPVVSCAGRDHKGIPVHGQHRYRLIAPQGYAMLPGIRQRAQRGRPPTSGSAGRFFRSPRSSSPGP